MLIGEDDLPAGTPDEQAAGRVRRDNMAAIRHACRLVENRGNRVLRSGRDLLAATDPNTP
ncbi:MULTISPECIES: hypothetical protein [Acidiphilium]|uniref:hypothetical protein n=1 Tax=Acidiphilium TaxID=522 RepID=UPI001F4C13DE|nr:MULTISPECIES: hypothetical protein [Acidiphilium]